MRRWMIFWALCLLLCGCAEQAEAPAPALRSDNGRPVVQVAEDFYFWRYQASSVEPEGLWGDYAPLPAAENELVRLSADGAQETVYTGPFYGNLWYLDGRLFAQGQAGTETGVGSLTCLTLDGEALWTLDRAEVLAADPDRGFLLCRDARGYGTLFLLTADGARTDLAADAAFLTCGDGAVYYQDKRAQDRAVLCRADCSGGTAELARVAVGAPGYGPEIVQAELMDEAVYFLCGSYGGTAHIFQGGRLCQIAADGTGFQVLAETGGYDDRFFLRREAGRTSVLYCAGFEDADVWELDAATGAEEKTAFSMAGLREPFLSGDGALWWYPDRTGRAGRLTAPIVFPETADAQKVRDVAVTEDWVWYTLETGHYSAAASVGWRDGYTRQRTWVCRQPLGGGAEDVLYEY